MACACLRVSAKQRTLYVRPPREAPTACAYSPLLHCLPTGAPLRRAVEHEFGRHCTRRRQPLEHDCHTPCRDQRLYPRRRPVLGRSVAPPAPNLEQHARCRTARACHLRAACRAFRPEPNQQAETHQITVGCTGPLPSGPALPTRRPPKPRCRQENWKRLPVPATAPRNRKAQ